MQHGLKDPLEQKERLDHLISVRLTASQFQELTHLSGSLEVPRTSLIQDAIANYLKRFRPLKSTTATKSYLKK
jgi:predicted DNA-binding protein